MAVEPCCVSNLFKPQIGILDIEAESNQHFVLDMPGIRDFCNYR